MHGKGLININQFNEEYKEDIMDMLPEFDIDKGIEELVTAINEIDIFCSAGSCQGELIPEESGGHVQMTYVDFYVLYHQYDVANNLLNRLVHKFGSVLNCQIWFEAGFDFIGENEIRDNGRIELRYRIEIYANDCMEPMKTYKDIVREVKQYKGAIL
ncbi:MAG: hypothetical protein ACQEP4_01875 [Bacillota bacterium]